MYENPITEVMSDISTQIIQEKENQLMMQFRQTLGYDIDKNELIKALQYDRDQYRKGYADAMKNKEKISELICDVNPEEIAAQIASGNLHNWCNILKREFGRLLEV
jgi:hypothetical protein